MLREQNKKLRVFVCHELWIGDLKYDLCTLDTSCASAKYRLDGMRFENASTYFQSKSVKRCDLNWCVNRVELLENRNQNRNDSFYKRCYTSRTATMWSSAKLCDEQSKTEWRQERLNQWMISLILAVNTLHWNMISLIVIAATNMADKRARDDIGEIQR
eukprot:331378_1